MWRILLVLSLVACADRDLDGFVDQDCDNSNAAINPKATDQVGDGIDQNCDGMDGTDLDLDGFASEVSGGEDCDDTDQDINPDAEDLPYDGIDQDCDGEDLPTDVDGDGYDADTYGGPDCDDDDPSINPDAGDVPYDGIDQDCDGADLTDVDGDGFDSEEVGGDDCDDLDSESWPSAPETPYDGIDQDCDGYDLTDVDGDGYDGLVAGGLDCVDDDASIYPFAPDTCYDGINHDCSDNTDYDCDADGYDSDAWGGTDCDDNNPFISEEGLEHLQDGADTDCAAGDDASFAFGPYFWDNPRPPRLAATTNHYILATSADEVDLGWSVDSSVGAALVFERDSTSGADTYGDPVFWQGQTNPQPLGSAVALVTSGADFWASTSYTHAATTWTYIVVRQMEWDPALALYDMGSLEYAGTNITYDSLDVDLVLDTAGQPWAASCGLDTLHTVKAVGQVPAPFDALGPGPVFPSGVPGGVCFWNAAPDPAMVDAGDVVLCEPGADCASYDFDPVDERLTLGAQQPWAHNTVEKADFREGWHNVVYSTGEAWVHGAADHQIFAGHQVSAMDAVWYDGDLYAVAIVDDTPTPELILSWGDPAVGMSELTLDHSDPARPGLVLTGAAVMADVDRLVIAITANDPANVGNDAVGWSFYGW